MEQLEKIASAMRLKCDNGCDHKFCLNSFISMTFDKGQPFYTGSFSKIFLYNESQSNKEFACKLIEIPDEIKYIEEMANTYLHDLQHERIINFFGNIEKGNKLYIFMEFMNGGTLHDKIQRQKPMPHDDIIKHTKQILEGVAFLHENEIIHRDIKPSNILLDKEDNVKICDFGMSRSLRNLSLGEERRIYVTTRCGTYNYMAPEIINAEKYSFPVDIWSVGATVVEMVSGKAPFHNMSQTRVIVKISESKKIEFEPLEPMSNNMENLINEMLKSNPSERPSAKELLNYEIFM